MCIRLLFRKWSIPYTNYKNSQIQSTVDEKLNFVLKFFLLLSKSKDVIFVFSNVVAISTHCRSYTETQSGCTVLTEQSSNLVEFFAIRFDQFSSKNLNLFFIFNQALLNHHKRLSFKHAFLPDKLRFFIGFSLFFWFRTLWPQLTLKFSGELRAKFCFCTDDCES